MVVVLSRYAKVQFCPSKMFRTPVTPHETNLLLSEITVGRLCWAYRLGGCVGRTARAVVLGVPLRADALGV